MKDRMKEDYYRAREVDQAHNFPDIKPEPPRMKVEVVQGMMVAENVAVVEGNTCIVVYCKDHDYFRALPAVVSYNGILCGKTGYNSDTERACYQSNATLLRVVGRK